MKAKKLCLVLLVMFSLIIPFTLTSFALGDPQLADPDIEWGVKEGSKYTWVVKVTTTGFLPVDSEYELTIDTIKIWPSGGGMEQTELFVNLTSYNSITEVTTPILNNQSFIYFDVATSTTSFYAPFDEHGFCMTTNYRDEFHDGLVDYFFGPYGFNLVGSGSSGGRSYVYGAYSSSNLIYIWFFNSNLVSTDFVIADINADLDDPEDFDYWVELQVSTKEAISYGNFFLIIMGVAIVSLIYLYRKRFK